MNVHTHTFVGVYVWTDIWSWGYMYGHIHVSPQSHDRGGTCIDTHGSGGTCMDTHMVVQIMFGHTHGSVHSYDIS